MRDLRPISRQELRNLSEEYFYTPGDKILNCNKDAILVETVGGEKIQMMAEEFIVKNIRKKILEDFSSYPHFSFDKFMKEAYFEEYGEDDILTEGVFHSIGEKMRWAVAKSSLKLLSTDTLDDIIRHRYKNAGTKLDASRKEKLKIVREIANQLTPLEKSRIANFWQAEQEYSKGGKIATGGLAGVGGMALATSIALAFGNTLLGAVFGIGGLVSFAVAGSSVKNLHRAKLLSKERIRDVLLGKEVTYE